MIFLKKLLNKTLLLKIFQVETPLNVLKIRLIVILLELLSNTFLIFLEKLYIKNFMKKHYKYFFNTIVIFRIF